MLARLGSKKGFYAVCTHEPCARVHFVTDGDRRCPTHRVDETLTTTTTSNERRAV